MRSSNITPFSAALIAAAAAVALTLVPSSGSSAATASQQMIDLHMIDSSALSGSTNALAAGRVQSSTDIRTLVSSLASGSVLALPSGTYTFSNFESNLIGLDLSGKGGLTGQGIGKTVVEMTPHTSTKASSVPTKPGTSNNLTLLRFTGTPRVSGFTLQGTSQGHNYNGLRLSSTKSAVVSNIKVLAIPGSGYIPPQETFGINDVGGSGTTYSNVEIDGAGVGASGLATNSASNITVNNSNFHNNAYSAGAAFWQTANVTLTDVRSTYNRTGLNFERCSGTITITRPTIIGETNQDFYIGSDQTSAKITIINPTYSGHLRIRVPATYRGVANRQKKSDIRVLVNGVDKTSTVVTWI